MRMVIWPAVDADRLAKIKEAGHGLEVVNAQSQDEARAAIGEAEAFFGKMTPELLAAAPRLRWVQSPTASLEHYLFPELIAHPCQLSNMRGLFSDVIADHVMGYVLCFARHFPEYLRRQRAGRWEPIGGEDERASLAAGPGHVTGIDRAHMHLADCTLGVVGVGGIGAEVCRRAAAFGMTVLGVDPQTSSAPGVVPDVWRPEQLPELLAQSDFVVIAAPHTPETEKMFRAEQFRQMKRSAYLINVGRGIIVDLADLTAALESGEIAGAGLDVIETEPLPADHPLWQMDNVILTPHVAAASPRVAERHLQTLLENIERFVASESPITLVDKRRWY